MDKHGHWVLKAKRWQRAQDRQWQVNRKGPHSHTAENQREMATAFTMLWHRNYSYLSTGQSNEQQQVPADPGQDPRFTLEFLLGRPVLASFLENFNAARD